MWFVFVVIGHCLRFLPCIWPKEGLKETFMSRWAHMPRCMWRWNQTLPHNDPISNQNRRSLHKSSIVYTLKTTLVGGPKCWLVMQQRAPPPITYTSHVSNQVELSKPQQSNPKHSSNYSFSILLFQCINSYQSQ